MTIEERVDADIDAAEARIEEADKVAQRIAKRAEIDVIKIQYDAKIVEAISSSSAKAEAMALLEDLDALQAEYDAI
jgi:hypothetical protein